MHRIALVTSLILTFGVLGPGPSPIQDDGRGVSSQSSQVAPADRSRPAERERARRGDGRRRTAPSTGMTAEQIVDVIKTATDVNPQWGEWLSTLRRTDPDGLRRVLATSGRRLLALSVLRESKPELYQLNVERLRLESEARELADALRDANARNLTAEADTISAQLRRKVTELIDLDLKARAQELASLDARMKALKAELDEDIANRPSRVNAYFERLANPPATRGHHHHRRPPAETPVAPDAEAPARPARSPKLGSRGS
jgi:hypothetical protein